MMKFVFILLVIVIVVLLLKRNTCSSSTMAAPQKRTEISFDDEVICVRYPDGELRNVSWAALSQVGIRTTDDGPWSADVFWELYEDGDKPVAVFASGSSGDSALLDAMQERLPDFDNQQVIAAMGSTSQGYFEVCRRDNS